MRVLSRDELKYLRNARIARLATVDRLNSIHIVPVVFAISGSRIYFVVDLKAKKEGRQLKRIRNISETKKAALLIDNYSENWEKLSFLLIHCSARVIDKGENLKEKLLAAKKLKEKYSQYAYQGYFPDDINESIFVRLEPQKAVFWQNLRASLA